MFLVALAGILDFVVGACTLGGSGSTGNLVPSSVACSAVAGPALGLYVSIPDQATLSTLKLSKYTHTSHRISGYV